MRTLIADHQAKVRFALRVTLERQLGFTTIFEAVDADDLIAQAKADCPDLLIVDWKLPGMPVAELIGIVRGVSRKARLIVIDSCPETRERALVAGANAFVCMCDAPSGLISAIDACVERAEPE